MVKMKQHSVETGNENKADFAASVSPNCKARAPALHRESNSKSSRTLKNLKEVCERDFPGEYTIEIVDLSKNPGAARQDNVIALPAVVRMLPAPIRKFIGTLSGDKGVLTHVDLTANS